MKNLTRRILKAPALGAAISLLSSACGFAAEKPNIVFIFADDWGYGDIGIHGSTFCDTPSLDRMAAEGTDFTNFTVNSPVCSPSRVAVMTGQFPARQAIHQHFAGIQSNAGRGMPDWMDPEGPSVARMLQEAGYKTGHFGKWHLGRGPTEDLYGYDAFATFNGSKKNEIKKEGLASVDHAENFIRENKDEPFFVNLWLHEVHTAHYPQERYLEKFKGLNEQERVYASVIAEGDEGVGRILKLLKELDLDENTLVVFSTDNGPESSKPSKEHKDTGGLGHFYSVGETAGLKGEKRSLFSGGIRVPFIVRWPGVVPAGKTDETSVVTAVDLLPTFLAAGGVDLPAGYEPDGENILAAFKGEKFERKKPIFWEWRGGVSEDYTWPSLGIHEGRWKLLINKELNKVELYDLEKDWAEQNDLAAEFPEVVQQLTEKIDAWKNSLPTEAIESCCSPARAKKSKPKAKSK
ncbi:sulfatase [Luteolibacter sp. AS25]|uniref:sulfatase family protein n=1 Tax=Luteolibacter sp. AS25 TaxID=3135776 RepID=UPI00398A714C